MIEKGEIMLEAILNELRQEAATTKRVLEAVPADKLTWQPHSKTMRTR